MRNFISQKSRTMDLNTLESLYLNLDYGTLREVISSLKPQILELKEAIETKQYIYSEKKDEEKISLFLELIEPVIKIYHDDGGIPLEGSVNENFVKEFFPHLMNILRLN